MGPRRARSKNHLRFEEGDYLKKLLAAGSRASSLGIAVLDWQTRFESVNASLARETQAAVEHHLGKTTREIVGEIAGQVEPTYERVLKTGKAESILPKGHVRDTPEYGYWLTHCFPILDSAGRVEKLGLFVVNITAERTATEIFNSLTADPKRLLAEEAGLLEMFDESVRKYHLDLRRSFDALVYPSIEPARKAECFHSSIQRMDENIHEMRGLIYAVISQFSVPAC